MNRRVDREISAFIKGGLVKLYVIAPVQKMFTTVAVVAALSSIAGCSQQKKDKEIKADITIKAKTDVNFVGVNYTVDQGIVTLTGTSPAQKTKEAVEHTVKSINIIKGVNNQIKVGSVLLDNDYTLKLAVDSVLADYPAVEARVEQQVVTLLGKTPKQEAGKLLPAIDKLHPAKVENELVME
ncbi:BON domain-containing protein [Mucilaginibacter robiniae]|uniref:BON domain-containing protein n=1 Tax=Mucilaginibacter robiniae TaxID=2728022 RepID=A0A7L5DYH9_9SPHI|nr:BON domain-containing protein [Mucilaginibacter robiniae]QJD95831.1 BON domain-containing protein [Mucilaginibacter robiniae]